MNRVLSEIEPKKVFEVFEDICAIPHGSGNTKGISDYCVAFARKRGFPVYQDDLNNVIIEKPASKGYQSSPPVVLQGHLDMVCEKDANIDFDFSKDSLRLKLDGDYLSAVGTTLGADDGVAIALALGILDAKDLPHPPLRVVFTSDEETGMYGAAGLDVSRLKSNRFINLDSENEGVFTVGCAGGVRVDISLPIKTERLKMKAFKVEVSGLKGGHSGTEINKGGLNANKVLGAFLSELKNVRISEISGGFKDNAIPVSSFCVLSSDSDVASAAKNFVDKNAIPADRGLKITVTNQEADSFCTSQSSEKIINMLLKLPCGVKAISRKIAGLVETSLNLGIMNISDGAFKLSLSVRSSKENQKDNLKKELFNIGESFGAEVYAHSDYPAWEYRENSPLREKMSAVFRNIYGKEPQIEIIHAGLECGILGSKIPDIDAVSIGPDMFDIHTPRERLSCSSLARIYNYLCKVLEALK